MNKLSIKQILTASALYCLLLSTPVTAAIYSTSDSVLRFQKTMAEKGVVESQYTLGFMYETGLHVAQSIEDSIEWYDKASAQDYQPAIDRLTYLQIKSTGYKQEHVHWLGALKEKARASDKDALFLLGQMYSEGTAVNKSLTLSLKLLRQASRSDRPEIEAEIIRVESELAKLQQQYQPAATDTNKSSDKVTPDRKKPQNKPAIKDTLKTNPDTQFKQSINVKPHSSIKKNIKYTVNSNTNSVAINTDIMSDQTTVPTTKPEIYTHPMDIMCSGSNRMVNGCR